MGWQAIDELIRAFDGRPAHNTPIATKLITKANSPTGAVGWQGDVDYQARYRALWGLR